MGTAEARKVATSNRISPSTKEFQLEEFGQPTIYCKSCHVIFHVVSAISVAFENIRFSQGLGEETREKERGKTTVFQVHSTILRISSCYFDSIPYAIHFQGEIRHNLICYNNIFIHPVKAIHIAKVGYSQYLSIRNCQFIGEPRVTGEAVIIIQQDTNADKHMSRLLLIEVYNSSFSFLKNSIYVEVLHVKNTTIKVSESSFMNNRMKSLPKLNRMSYIERSAGIAVFGYTLSKRIYFKIAIRGSQFINNTSIYGGSISLNCGHRADLVIEKCIFKDNVAIMSGGAVQLTGNCEVAIRSSSFISNRCDRGLEKPEIFSSRLYDPYGIGGAIMLFAYEHAPFDPFHYRPEALISECEFTFNSAEYSGGAIYTNSHILNIERTLIESSQEIPSRNIESQLIRCKYRCNLANVSFVVGNAANSRAAALFGESNVALRLDQVSTFKCPKGSILVYNKLRSLEKSSVLVPPKMALRKNFMMFVFYCFNCPPDHYNLMASFLVNSTLNNEKCQKCPPGGVCKAGIIRPKSNFWGFIDKNSDRASFIQLPKGYGCLGSQCRDINSCAIGRTVILCATCEIGLSESMLSKECIKNKECNFTVFWALACVLFSTYLIFFIFKKEIVSMLSMGRFSCFCQRSCHQQESLPIEENSIVAEYERRRNGSDESEENKRNISTAVVKILFYFFQVESLVIEFRSNYEKTTESKVGGWLGNFFNFDFFQSQAASTCAIYNATPVDKILIRFCFVMSLFLVMAVVYVLVWVSNKGRSKIERPIIIKKGKLTLTNKIMVASFEIFLLNYALFVNTIFNLLRCVKINGELFLHVQGNIKCYREWQYVLMVLGIVWALPFCIFVFILPWLFLRRRIKRGVLFIGCLFPLPLIVWVCFKSSEIWRGADIKRSSRNNDERQEEEMEEEEEVKTEVEAEKEKETEEEEVEEEMQPEVEVKEERDAQIHDTVLAEILKNRVGPFSAPVNRHLVFSWEGVYILRRLLIVAFSSFITDPVYKLYTMLLAQVLFLLHHLHLKPYAAKSMNHLETISLTVLVLINSMNLLAAYSYSQGLEKDGNKHRLLLIFWWIQVMVETLVPMFVFIVVVILIIIYLMKMFTALARALIRTFCK